MHPIPQAYLDAGRDLKLPVILSNSHGGIELRLAGKRYIFFGGQTPFNDAASSEISLNKFCTNLVLDQANIPVPEATIIFKEDYESGSWQEPYFSYPLVAKPTTNKGGRGRDVFCNIQDKPTLIAYLDEHFKKYDCITLEKFESGLTDYRVIVFFNQIIGVTRRDPAHVFGDRKHSISELIALQNLEREKNTTTTLGPIVVDKEYETRLKESNLTLDYVPRNDEKIMLCYSCNIGRGGTTVSLGKAICPENAELLCRAAKILNLKLVGFDVLCEDIQIPIEQSRGFIIEANCNPDFTIHEAPLAGPVVPIAKVYLKHLIRRHPFAYAKHYLRQRLASYTRISRALLAIGLLLGLTAWLRHL